MQKLKTPNELTDEDLFRLAEVVTGYTRSPEQQFIDREFTKNGPETGYRGDMLNVALIPDSSIPSVREKNNSSHEIPQVLSVTFFDDYEVLIIRYDWESPPMRPVNLLKYADAVREVAKL